MPTLNKNNNPAAHLLTFLLPGANIFLGAMLLVVAISFLSVTICAQAPFFHVKEISAKLSRGGFNTIYEDHTGRIYLGAESGLLFFDGQKLLNIPVLGDSSISVSAIFQTDGGQLLVGTTKGTIYELAFGQLRPFPIREGYPKAMITGFQQDKQQRLWLSTYGEGVYFLDQNHLYNIDEEDGLPANDIYVMTACHQGQIWLGTDGGISVCSFENGQKIIRNITRENGLPDEIVHSIRPDKQGNCWIGMYDHGFCRYNSQTDTIDFVIPQWTHGIVNDLELFEEQELWVATEGNGLFRYSFSEKMVSKVGGNIDFSKANVKALLRDVEGNIWVLDNLYKLSCANKQFERLNVPVEHIQSLLVDQNKQLWIGTEKGLFVWDKKDNNNFVEVGKDKKLNVTSLFQDKYQNIWIGTFGQGVYLYYPASKIFRHFSEAHGLTNNSVLSIDGINGHVWLATLGGVTEVATDQNPLKNPKWSTSNFNQSNGLGTNFIYKVFVDSQQRVWFGTDGKGLSMLENGHIKNYQQIIVTKENQSDTIDLKTIYCITEDHRGHIWFSTSRNGVFEFDGKNFHKLSLKADLDQIIITGLIGNHQRDILLVYPSGVAILDPETHHLIYFDHEVGLEEIDPNLNAVTGDSNGNIWLASQSQLIKYVALKEDLEIHPRTILDELIVNYQSVPFQEQAEFKHNQNNIIFRYTGLWYTAPEKVRYKYRLKGYASEWIFSKDNQVSYSSLPPGDYTFEVIATENNAFDDEPIVSYSFTILKPFWQQTWFVIGNLLLFFTGVYAFVGWRDRRRQRENELQRGKLSSQLEALKAQINPHFLFNSFNTLITLIDENQEAAVEYVERLSDFYRSMLQYRDVEVIPIQEEIELVKDYSFLLKKRYGENFSIEVNVNSVPAYIAPLSLQTLVENAVKHNIISKAKPLKISIDIENNSYVTVTNNIQKKLQAEPSTHFGLQSLTRQYELLSDKKVKIEETEEVFKVSLPLLGIGAVRNGNLG
jgi:ligand-binding sensor domain-containing protein